MSSYETFPNSARPKRASRFGWLGRFAVLLSLALGGYFLIFHHYPYVIENPGPTLNVLGTLDSKPLIETPNGHEGTSSTHLPGQLRMVTVSLRGGPGNRNVTGIELIAAKLSSSSSIQPYSKLFPPHVTGEQEDKLQKSFLESSMNNARAAALTYLKVPFRSEIIVSGIAKNSNAQGKLKEGDKLESIEVAGQKTQIKSTAELFNVLQSVAPGTNVKITYTPQGQSTQQSAEIKTVAPGKNAKGSRLGIYISIKSHFPIDIKINVGENIGGPSAGLIFTLGIIQRMTPTDIVGDNKIAGTGTISVNGKVGPIGGIVQKIYGAKRDGAKWFLAPKENCTDLKGAKLPTGIRIVSVNNLDEAMDSLKAIKNGNGDSLPACPLR
ncbi:hypothetical protein KRX54_03785 [Actinomycetaceae bacterium TAE3-ERU4]|nr:hypothetical protein [Actinomycetaceae bacterium TAE3-ERU4]